MTEDDPVQTCSFRVRAEPEDVRRTMQAMRARLGGACRPELLDRAELVLAEALNNVAEHAFADRPARDTDIELTLRARSREIHVHVVDGGAAMPDGQLPLGRAHEIENLSLQDLPEGGFGWNLIRRLTDELCYKRDGRTNHLTFRIFV